MLNALFVAVERLTRGAISFQARQPAISSLVGKRPVAFFENANQAVNANFKDAAARPPQAQLRRGSQLKDHFPRLTGARS